MNTDEITYLPPHNFEAEEAVLGSLMIDPVSIDSIRDILNAESFYKETHRWIYEAMLKLADEDTPIDFMTLTSELKDQEQLEELGGEAYIIGLINVVPTSVNDIYYAKIVEEKAERRRMIRAASEIARLAHDETESLSDAIEQTQKIVYDLGRSVFSSTVVHIKQPASEIMELIEERSAAGSKITGIATGFTDLDFLLGGLQPTELFIIAGRPGMGKSAFQGTIAMLSGVKDKKNVGIFSMEMSAVQWVLRMISGMAKIDSHHLKRGELGESDWPVFYDAVGRLSETNIYIDDSAWLTPEHLLAKCRRLASEHGLDLVIVDYIQMMTTKGRFNNRVQEISYITKSLKALAKEIECPVLASSQLSRAVEQRADKRPQLSDLRDSGNIEEDADVVAFIYRDEYYNPETSERPNITEINIAKNRNGYTGQIDLYWKSKETRFYNLQRQEIKF